MGPGGDGVEGCRGDMSKYTIILLQITALLDTTELSAELRPLVPLYMQLLFASPMMKNGNLIPYENVVKLLNADVIEFSSEIGIDGSKYPRLLSVGLKVSI